MRLLRYFLLIVILFHGSACGTSRVPSIDRDEVLKKAELFVELVRGSHTATIKEAISIWGDESELYATLMILSAASYVAAPTADENTIIKGTELYRKNNKSSLFGLVLHEVIGRQVEFNEKTIVFYSFDEAPVGVRNDKRTEPYPMITCEKLRTFIRG